MRGIRLAGIGAVVIIWTACVGTTFGQFTPPEPGSSGPPVERRPSFNPAGDMQREMTSRWPSPDNLTLGLEFALVIMVLGLLVWVGVRVYRRVSAPSDPVKAAMNDPWVRAQSARPNDLGPQAGDAP